MISAISHVTEQKQVTAQLLAYQEQLRALAAEVALAEERERQRIATELHDQIGQLLALAKLRLGAWFAAAPGETAMQPLEDLRALLDQAIRATRALTFDLSSPHLHKLGLVPALESLGEWLEEEHGIRCHVTSDHQSAPLSAEFRALLFRIGRELLCNVVKHAQARQVRLSLAWIGAHLYLTVHDNGRGFDATWVEKRLSPTGGFGLFSISESVARLGGHLEIVSAPGEGTRVVVAVPVGSRMVTENGPAGTASRTMSGYEPGILRD
jgi:signal transduction histidine kinase